MPSLRLLPPGISANTKPNPIMSTDNNEFEKASEGKQAGIVSEFLSFLKQNKKFWLLPLILVMLALGVLIMLGGTAAAPFIYTLF